MNTLLVPANFFDPEPEKWITVFSTDDPGRITSPAWDKWAKRQVKPDIDEFDKKFDLDEGYVVKEKDEAYEQFKEDEKYYEQHRIKYEGFVLAENGESKLFQLFDKRNIVMLNVEFRGDLLGTVSIRSFYDKVFKLESSSITHETFQKLCSDHGIELKIV